MDTPSSFQTDSLIAEDIDAYLDQHQRKSPVNHRLPAAQPDDTGLCRFGAAAAHPCRDRQAEKTGMIGRIVWFTALAVIALVTVILQFDLRTRAAPETATSVPGPLRNYAQVQIVNAALAGEDPARALVEAERLMQRRPVPAEYLTLLAAAQFKANQLEAGARTIQVAGQRGWRDPVAQEAVLRIALAAGDKAEAARRYAALFLRDATPNALLKDLGPAVLGERDGAGQRTMVAIVVGGERWHKLFLRRGAGVMPSAAFGAIVASSLREGAAFDCAQLGQVIKALQARDATAADEIAVAAGASQCPQLAPKSRSPL